MTRTAAQIRQEFIDFFCQRHGHTFVPSAPVVPHEDPTLLFTNAGMNQFKPLFLGQADAKTAFGRLRRAANTQKCIRAGGKHNDLDDVGHDTYHHTFFEMLGNWSFGDYFKREAIAWAWELLTQVWGLDKQRLHATYFGGDAAEGLEPDFEARDLWLEIMRKEGLEPDREDPPPSEGGAGGGSHVHAGSKKDNFWEMGDTGPCGPCSEIHIDLTPDISGARLVNAGDARVMEIWNLVFIQFNRGPDGALSALPSKHVDTGMGFERVTAVIQGQETGRVGQVSNYDTDVFAPIFAAIQKVTGAPPYGGRLEQSPSGSEGQPASADPAVMRDVAYRVIADHIRTLTFAITDGAVPDKEGRGYVLRRILRRAVRYGWQYLDTHRAFLCELVPAVVQSLGDAFPELKKDPGRVQEVIREEEESFGRTLDRGLILFTEEIVAAYASEVESRYGWKLAGAAYHPDSLGIGHLSFETPEGGRKILAPELDQMLAPFRVVISGETAFRLHDTYGFPIDLTEIMAAERGLSVDIAGYERLMAQARERARAARRELGGLFDTQDWGFVGGPTTAASILQLNVDDSAKYRSEELEATVQGCVRIASDGAPILFQDAASVQPGETAGIIVDRTCFYAEQGGQVGDIGVIESDGAVFEVEKTIRYFDRLIVHFGVLVRGILGSAVRLRVDAKRRATMKNHTATHLLNWALREVLGDHVQQKGSLVDHEKTRFDFSHPKPLTPEEAERVERLVNERIRKQEHVDAQVVPQEQALKIHGLRAVFGERYPDMVRVLSVGERVEELIRDPANPRWREVSVEFCGGTHVRNTGEIEHFALVSEEAVAKGVRRVVGITGEAARAADAAGRRLIQRAEEALRGAADGVHAAASELQAALGTAVIPVHHRHRLRELIEQLQKRAKEAQKATTADAVEVVRGAVEQLLRDAAKVGATVVVVGELPDVPLDALKTGADMVKQRAGSAAVLFGVRSMLQSEPRAQATGQADEPRAQATGQADEPRAQATGPAAGKVTLLAAMSNDLVKRGLKAGDLVKAIAPIVGGGGGGPPTMAQAGGKLQEKLAEALAAGRAWIVERLT
ncbi:MAG: alanine--tRNA ligase-related protein [Planctomycetota bacterium]